MGFYYPKGRFDHIRLKVKDDALFLGAFTIRISVSAKFEFIHSDTTEWTPDEAEDWIESCLAVVFEAWSLKFPINGVDRDDSSNRVVANIEVRVQPTLEDSNRTLVNVYRSADDMRRSGYSPDDNVMYLKKSDVDKNESKVDDNVQFVVAHEFGHALEFYHSAAETLLCPQSGWDAVADECYGEAWSRESADIMGRGMDVRRGHYKKFSRWLAHLPPTMNYEWSVGEYR